MKNYGSMPRTTKLQAPNSYDNRTYKTVEIGSQTWMAEDFKNFATPPLIEYGDNKDKLYKFEVASELCIEGWRLPNKNDWEELMEFVNNDIKKLKAIDGWDINGTDDYGFAARPGGSYCNNVHQYLGTEGHWWTSDNYYSNLQFQENALAYKFSISNNSLELKSESKECFLSVRCIKEQ